MRRAALVLVAAFALPGGLGAQTSVDQTRPAASDVEVSIENLSGSVKVSGWTKPAVQVKGTLAAGAELSLTGSGKSIQIEVEAGHNPMAASALEVFMPAGGSVSIESFQATITVTGVTGAVEAETVNGSITHAGPSKDVNLQSVNGAVETTKASGRVQVEAVNGSVGIRDASGELEASTVNGRLSVAGGSFDRAKLETVAGELSLDSTISPKGTLDVESVSGAVSLFLPPGFSGSFKVSSFTGAITNELAGPAEKTSGWGPGKELTFTSGSGGARVSIETLSGAVNIHKKR